MNENHILIIDDEKNYLLVLETLLSDEGYRVTALDDPEMALAYLEESEVDVVITDMKMPGISGKEVLAHMKHHYPYIPVLIMTAFGSIESAVETMRVGAFNYIEKPFTNKELLLSLQQAILYSDTQRENKQLRAQINKHFELDHIIGKSRAMNSALSLVERAAPSKSNILITGEPGTGKELFARAIHKLSPRKDAPFASINCKAIHPEVLKNELWGFEQESTTGATSIRRGVLELTNGGTLFIEEIEALPLDLQIKLLQTLQQKEFLRTGGTSSINVNVRVITSSTTDLEPMLKAGTFREDLYYFLNVVSINLPPLRHRREDIQSLAMYFLQKAAQENDKNIKNFDARVMEYIIAYDWPGNIQQLENTMERCTVLALGDTITLEDMPMEIRDEESLFKNAVDLLPTQLNLANTLDRIEAAVIRRALVKSQLVQVHAAEMLGVSKSNLQYKLKKYSIAGK